MRKIVLLIAAFVSITSAYAQPTYSREVSRIMRGKCQRCHRPNDIAPGNPIKARLYQKAKRQLRGAERGSANPGSSTEAAFLMAAGRAGETRLRFAGAMLRCHYLCRRGQAS